MNYQSVIAIEEIEETEDVYDIEVNNTHNFFANNMCVHNCLAGKITSCVVESLPLTGDVRDYSPGCEHDFEKAQGLIKEYIEKFEDVFGKGNYFLEIQFNRLPIQHLVNLHILEASRRNGIKVVATADAHYANPEHWKEREIYKAMAWAKHGVDKSQIPERIEDLKCELFPKNAEQMWQSFLEYGKPYEQFYAPFLQEVADSIEITHDIAWKLIDKPTVDKTVKLPALPRLVESETIEKASKKLGETASEVDVCFEILKMQAIQGLKFRGKEKDQRYIDRMRKELQDIKILGFAKYFLTEKKIIDLTAEKLLLGNGRGSVSGSLLAYCLNISQVDPIRWETLWERFLTRHKKGSYPDIDNDWSDRDKALALLVEHFGKENVIPVSTFSQLQLRSLMKDLARLEEIPHEEVNLYTSKIEKEVLEEKKKEDGFDRGTWVLTYEEAEKFSPSFRAFIAKYPKFERLLKILFKQMRGVGRHAGGVIITDNAPDNLPLIAGGKKEKRALQTPWPEGVNYRHLEEYGFLKFDILATGTLRMFEECIRKILIKEGNPNPSFFEIKKFFYEKLHPDNNPMTDENVYKHVFWNGNYAGIFQFVKPNTQRFMKEMKPTNIVDISIATSIHRPGPLGLDVDKTYLNNRRNPAKIKYRHEKQKEVLADTAGCLIFQEQLQMIYHKLCGIPLDETDKIRKAFTKKEISNKEQAAKDRDALRNTFIQLCKSHSNIEENTSGQIFDDMEKLVSYSFNRSHAIAYSITTWQCAWFLTYYPDEWITTYMDYCAIEKGDGGGEDPKVLAMKEAKILGYRFSKPDINYSFFESTIHPKYPKVLVPAFSSLQYLGETAVNEIMLNRPYNSFIDVLIDPNTKKWRHSKFNKRSLDTLIKLEAFDSLDAVGQGKLFDNYRHMYEVVIGNHKKLIAAAKRKKDNDVEALVKTLAEETRGKIADWSVKEKIDFQQTLSGTVDFELLVDDETIEQLAVKGYDSIDNFEEDGKYWGVVGSAVVSQTKNGKPFLKLSLFGKSMKEKHVKVWNYKTGVMDLQTNDVVVADIKFDDYGFSTFQSKLKKLKLI